MEVTAQTSCDPGDQFYIIAQGWEMRNVVERLPSLRPYPITVIQSILEEVLQKGTEHDKQLAQIYYENIFGKPWKIEAHLEDNVKLVHGDDKTGNQICFNPYVSGDVSLLNDLVGIGYKLGLYNTTADASQFLHIYQNSTHDAIRDCITIGPFDSYLDMNTCASIGNKDFYVQAGVYRTGFGAYINEGLALNDSAYHAANISFHLNQKRWAFYQQLSVIGATTNTGEDIAPNKFLSFHAIDFFVNTKLKVSYYETIVYGQRFDPSYLFPSPYMVTQEINGCKDNLQMGVVCSLRPFKEVSFDTDLFVDFLSINQIAQFNFNALNCISLKTGMIYTPENSICSRLAIDYTMITPYTYSHWDYDSSNATTMSSATFNYQNYTNNGINMGASYPPNSDRISFTIDLMPLKRLHVQVLSTFMRHANICENLTDEEAMVYLMAEKGLYATDGSVYMTSEYSKSGATSGDQIGTAYNNLNFLTQSDKMYIMQGGVYVDYILKQHKWGRMSFKVGYLFEYIKNKGVDSNIYEGGNLSYNGSTGIYTWKGSEYSSAAQVVSAAKASWREGFYDVVDNYLSFSIVYKY